MADMNSIAALLAALKQREQSGAPDLSADSGEDDAADSEMPMGGMGEEDDTSSPDDAAQNAQVVDILQDQYPSIYAKILKQVGDSSDQGDAAGAPAQSGAPASPPPGMM